MSFAKYAVPSWIRETMPERAEELAALADSAALRAVHGQIQTLRSSVDGFETAAAGGHRRSAVEFLGAARAAIAEILAEISDAPTAAVPVLRPAAGIASGSVLAAAPPTPEQTAKKRRNAAAWYYIRDHKEDRYADPADFKTRNPEGYRTMWQEAAALFDAGQITAAGKPVTAPEAPAGDSAS